MADQMHANKAKYSEPGGYTNEIVAVYLGKTALEDTYMIIAADGYSGSWCSTAAPLPDISIARPRRQGNKLGPDRTQTANRYLASGPMRVRVSGFTRAGRFEPERAPRGTK